MSVTLSGSPSHHRTNLTKQKKRHNPSRPRTHTQQPRPQTHAHERSKANGEPSVSLFFRGFHHPPPHSPLPPHIVSALCPPRTLSPDKRVCLVTIHRTHTSFPQPEAQFSPLPKKKRQQNISKHTTYFALFFIVPQTCTTTRALCSSTVLHAQPPPPTHPHFSPEYRPLPWYTEQTRVLIGRGRGREGGGERRGRDKGKKGENRPSSLKAGFVSVCSSRQKKAFPAHHTKTSPLPTPLCTPSPRTPSPIRPLARVAGGLFFVHLPQCKRLPPPPTHAASATPCNPVHPPPLSPAPFPFPSPRPPHY